MRAALRVAPSRPKPFEVRAGCPHFQRLDVTKPRYRGGCTVVNRCFQAPAPGQGAGVDCAMELRVASTPPRLISQSSINRHQEYH